jgi:hypothetical protein
VLAAGCSSTVIIYDYSGHGRKPGADTVHAEKPAVPSTPAPGTSVAPHLPDPSVIPGEQTGRTSYMADLVPGTARVETILAPAESLVVFRVHGNLIDGGGAPGVEVDPETRRNTVTGVKRHFLHIAFDSASMPSTEAPAGEIRIAAGEVLIAALDLSDAVERTAVPSGDIAGVRICATFETGLEVLRDLATMEGVGVYVPGGSGVAGAMLSDDDTLNFMTFYDVFAVHDGTKSALPEGLAPRMRESSAGELSDPSGR